MNTGNDRKPLIACAAGWLCLCGVAVGQSPLELVRRGNDAFRNGEVHQSAALYDRALEGEAERVPAEAHFNRGVAAYAQGDTDRAVDEFQMVETLDGVRRELALAARYNLGRIDLDRGLELVGHDPQAALKTLRTAADAFSHVWRENREDADAARNLEYARRAIKAIQDALAAQEQMQRDRESLAEDVNRAAERQESAADQTQQRRNAPPSESEANGQENASPDGQPFPTENDLRAMQKALAQLTSRLQQRLDELQQQAGSTSPQMPEENAATPQDQSAPPDGAPLPHNPAEADLERAQELLDAAREDQQRAAEALEQGALAEAEEAQRNAAQALRDAAEAIRPGGGQTPDQRQGQGRGPGNRDPNQQPQRGQQSSEDPNAPEQSGDSGDAQAGDGSNDAPTGREEEIISWLLERERQKQIERREQEVRLRRRQPVERDW